MLFGGFIKSSFLSKSVNNLSIPCQENRDGPSVLSCIPQAGVSSSEVARFPVNIFLYIFDTALKYFSEIPKYQILADKIYHWFTKNMQKSDGSFIFQINKFYKNKTSYIRWGQAWALYGLSSYLLFHSKNGKNSL